MDFFYSSDWLTREPPYAFQWDHLLFVAPAILIGVGIALFLRKNEPKTKKHSYIFLGFYIVLQLIFYPVIIYRSATNPSEYPFNIERMLPLHSCLMFMYVFPFAIFGKNKIIKTAVSNFLVVINMIMGFITLFVGYKGEGASALSYFGMHTLLYHSIDLIVPLIMIITGFYGIKKNDIWYGLALFGILGTTIYIFDAISGCDYFYFYDGHTFPAYKFISENVPITYYGHYKLSVVM